MTISLKENDNLMKSVFYSRQFSPGECQAILDIPPDPELTRINKEQMEAFLTREHSMGANKRQWIPSNPSTDWLLKKLFQIVFTVNAEQYQFEINHLAGTQILTLNPGEKLDWHVDLGENNFAHRKLGFVLFLSASQDYQGGHFHMGSGLAEGQDDHQGSFGIYPAYIMKRITEVTQGQLKILSTWGMGKKPLS